MSYKSFTFSWHCCWKSSLLRCDTHWVSGSFICRAKQSKRWIAWPCRWRNFNPSHCWELLTQQQGITSYRTWMSFFLTAVMSQSSWHITLQTLQWPLCKAAATPGYVLFSDIFSPYLLPWALICMNHQNQFLALGRKIGCLNHGCHTPSLVVNNKEENGCILLCLEL